MKAAAWPPLRNSLATRLYHPPMKCCCGKNLSDWEAFKKTTMDQLQKDVPQRANEAEKEYIERTTGLKGNVQLLSHSTVLNMIDCD